MKRSGWAPGPPEEAELTPEAFRDSLRVTGDEAEIDLAVPGIRCASCIWLIEHFLMKAEGITHASVNYATHKAKVRWHPETISLESVLKKISALGYTPRPSTSSDLEEGLKSEKRDLLVRFGTASFFSMQLMLYTAALYAGYFQGIDPFYKRVFEIIALALSTPVMFYCGHPFLKNAMRGIRNRAVNMDTLVFTGSFSAYAYSVIAIFIGGEVYFDTSATIITLILLGRFLEVGAKARATGAISSLIALRPKEASLISDGREPARVPVSALRAGDHIQVIPGDKIPVDCIVIDGVSEVDEAVLTGESMPVKKAGGAEVFAGTMNLNGRLVLEVKRIENDTVLSRIIKAVEDAQARKAPIQKVADRVVAWFVPVIIVIAAATFVFWSARGSGGASALMNGVSVLVIACPCALGLATPLAVLIGSTLLSSKGILAKGGDVIERIARSNFVSFDKTGTLTTGTPTLLKVLAYGIDERELRTLAASIEKHSEHTIARAIRKGSEDSELLPVDAFKAHPGKGVEGILRGEPVFAGSISFLESLQIEITGDQKTDFDSLSRGGNTVIGVAIGRELKGWFVISDDLRPGAAAVVEELNRLGCQVSLITGDHKSVAEEIGKRTGISIIDAEVLPVRKAEVIRRIRGAGYEIIMVGDGINDAPALIEADAGVAIGSATDIAIESADVVLLRNDLGLVPRLIETSRKTLSVIKENLFWAFSYNLIAIPLAVSGNIHPIISAAFMAISSLIVVGNSMRLRKGGFRD